MKAGSSVVLNASPDDVAQWLVDLGRYPQWMPMVHSAVADGDSAWLVELRAKVGPFARSKRLRMERTADETVDGVRTVVFDRREPDGSQHSRWSMTARISPESGGTLVSIDLEYGGALWTAGVLDKVLASNIDEGKKGLARVVSEPRH